ncbi:serine hydrolase domain-containing protein [Amycolatopsis anabasis]|uniref:serine hydrolase domain-containing protein n=1 Tax=Amycolatopsis anabasis TaxID=1840409 RepID=UPI00131DEEF7|nr:serine hydrolase domain-containing protein [Amycolatopsis anabasis]
MTRYPLEQSRRSALGFLGAVPLAAGGLLASGETADADPSSSGRIPRDLLPGGAFDRFVASLAAKDEFSGTVLLAHRGRPVLARAYGMADAELAIPNQLDTVFPLASASKPFTGLAIVQLVQRGKLELHEKLGAYLDGFPAEIANTVTVHQLLTHTSGMGDFQRPGGHRPPDKIYHSATDQMRDLDEFLRGQKLEFAPGTGVAYSSFGMMTLGQIVAKVSGQTFWDYVREHIFRPAGMTRSAYYTRTEWLSDKRIAHPYLRQPAGPRVDGVRNLDKGGTGTAAGNAARYYIGTGGGNGFSTAPDLVRFARALRDGTLLNRAYTELFLNGKVVSPPQPGGDPDPARQESFMAYGSFAGIFNNQRTLGHSGVMAGGMTNWSIYLDLDWTSVILSNYDNIDLQGIISREKHAVTEHRS